MKKIISIVAFLFVLGCMTVAVAGLWAAHEIRKPGEFTEIKEFMVPIGTSGYAVAEKLASDQIITQPKLFYALLRLQPASIKAGEYSIPAHSSLKDTLDIIRNGDVIERNFTLAEGLTVKQAMVLLNNTEFLTGEITIKPEEGTLMPDTYSFIRGDTRDSIIKRMQDAHTKLINELWEKRKAEFPLKSINEVVTLASIVEKETGIASERTRIAGLFYNRLKIGMPLQSDPTVVYVITKNLGHMEGKRLYAKSLSVDSPYNTYKNAGLPPGPIANPGRASLEAVFAPEENEYLFFVADGKGGHVFAKDLKGHNENVKAWRKFRKENKI